MSRFPLHILSVVSLGGFLVLGGAIAPAVQAQRSSGLPVLEQEQTPTEVPDENPDQASPDQPAPARIIPPPQPALPQPALPQLVPPQPIPTQQLPPVGTAPPLEESSYKLGAGDIINVNIFRVDQYSGESQVLVDGTLNLPLVGKVDVEGLSLDEASAVISSRYSQYLRRPILTLSLVARRPLQISVAGEVNRPGSYNIDQGNTQSSRLSQVIETAGGITQAANLSQVIVRRPLANGQQETISANLIALLENGDLRQDVILRDGDEVFIPTSQVPLANAALIADASFASDASQPINIAIIGEVYRPGPYTIESSGSDANTPKTITNAIQVAGGIKPRADIRKIQVVRPTRTGVPQVFEADLWQLVNAGNLQQDAILQAGDTVFVPKATDLTTAEINQIAETSFSPSTITVNIVGEVERAGNIELPPNTPLSQAILAAGGFNDTRARKGSAELVRIQEDGTVIKETVAVDFSKGIDEENNPLLRNNDVVIVNRSALATLTDTLGTVAAPLGGFFSIFRFFDIFN